LDTNDPAERFELRARIAIGNLFESFVGFDHRLKREVLIKRPAESSTVPRDDSSQMLQRSSEIARHLRHPNILTPISGFKQSGMYHAVYPYVAESVALDRETLRQNCRQFLYQMFSALDFLHCMGYVHCDLKRENFRVLRRGETCRVLLSDFDFLITAGTPPKGLVFGSPLHIAPEILRDEIVLPQSDYYSLGVMLLLAACNDASQFETHLRKLAEGSRAELEVTRDSLAREAEDLAPIISALLYYHHVERPANLGHLLQAHSSQLSLDVSHYENQLLWHLFRTHYRRRRKDDDAKRKGLREFLTNDVRLLGIPVELATDMERAGALSGADKYRAACRILSETSVQRYVDHFFVAVSLEDVEGLYERLGCLRTAPAATEETMPWVRGVRMALEFRVKGQPLKAAVLMRELLRNQSDQIPPKTRSLMRVKLGECSRQLGFSKDAREDFQQALSSNHLPPAKQIRVLLQQADLMTIDKNQKEHDQSLRKAYRIAKAEKVLRSGLRVLQRQLWTVYQKGRSHSALRGFRALARIAEKHNLPTHRFMIQQAIGSIESSLGNLDTAFAILQTAVRDFGDRVGRGHLLPPYINLGLISFERGEYKQAIEFTVFAKSLSGGNVSISHTGMIHSSLFSCYVLLGEYEKAERSIADYLEVSRVRGDRGAIGLYHLQVGWLNLRRGRYREAELELRYATAAFEPISAWWYLGRALLYLGTLYCWQGKTDLAANLQSRTEEVSRRTHDHLLLLDARQLRACLGLVQEGRVDLNPCITLVEDYLACRNTLGACSCLALLLFSGASKEVRTIVARSETLRKYLDESEAVFAQAVGCQMRAFGEADDGSERADVSRLKETFRRYAREGLCFHALYACLQIDKYYESTEQPSLRLRFLREALRLAKLIPNAGMADRIEADVAQLTARTEPSRSRLSAFHRVSLLLHGMSDYRSTAQQLLRLALDETNAERGAILLATEGGRNLRVEAAFDCDDESLSDIITLSKNVVRSVYDHRRGMFVEDALQDEATRAYRSVVVHNILSIACVPLISEERIIGVLYLDHHSLPGIFGTEERELIQSVANFIAVAFAHARALDLLQRQKEEAVKKLTARGSGTVFITRNRGMKDILEKLPIIADSDAAVLLRGESGTGKEILAAMIHQYSPYRDGPLVIVNCAELVGELLEANLFGIEKGVATGVTRREGRLHSADGGTLFLDEVGDMPLATQAKLLRVIETKQFEMVGSTVPETVDIRFVAATNKNLGEMIDGQGFRSDLYYRINTIEIVLPPLRERPEDIELLIEHFRTIFAPNRNLRFSAAAREALTAYSWPGNVRQLRNEVEKLCILQRSGVIDVGVLPKEITGAKGRKSAETTLRTKRSQ